MPTNILMPALSPTMEKGNLAKWLKKEGDTIKVDKSFIQSVETSVHAAAIVKATLLLGRSLNIPVLAEGVDVRYEDAVPLGDSAPRAGAFPHVYPGKLSRPQCDYACLVDAIRLELDPAGGTHIFPRHAFADSHEE